MAAMGTGVEKMTYVGQEWENPNFPPVGQPSRFFCDLSQNFSAKQVCEESCGNLRGVLVYPNVVGKQENSHFLRTSNPGQ